jgi:glycosyltransferase involved in cell wall biosynthesis
VIRRAAVEISAASVPRRPKVSIPMLAYNQESFISQAIDSVLMQKTDFEYELVIGEDCSTDRTRQIVVAYQQKHPNRIRLLLQPSNAGGSLNALETYAACRGEYIAELEGDDYWIDPLKVQLQVEMLEANPSAFICGARAYIWVHGAAAPSEMTPGQDRAVLRSYGTRELFEGKWWFRTCTKVFPRRLIQQVPLRFHRDWAGTMWLIAKTGFAPTCFLDRIVGVYRQHRGGMWSGSTQYGRVTSDIRVLSNLVPLFTGEARDYLKRLLIEHMDELLGLNDVPWPPIVKGVYLTVLRNPENSHAWRQLSTSLRRAIGVRR